MAYPLKGKLKELEREVLDFLFSSLIRSFRYFIKEEFLSFTN